jgi:selenocysteine-specific elongation factor
VLLELEHAGERGLDRVALRRRVAASEGQLDAATERLLARRALVRFDRARRADIAATVFEALQARALDAVAAHHRAHPVEPGIAREALRATVTDDARLLHRVLEASIESGGLVADGDRVRRKEHDVAGAARSSGVEALADRVAKILADSALAPPRPADLPAMLPGVAPAQLTGALDALVRAGRATRVQGLCFDTAALAALRERLVQHLAARGQITAAEWKEMSGVSRKYSIPLAEHFDAEKVTLRVGEVRKKRG